MGFRVCGLGFRVSGDKGTHRYLGDTGDIEGYNMRTYYRVPGLALLVHVFNTWVIGNVVIVILDFSRSLGKTSDD